MNLKYREKAVSDKPTLPSTYFVRSFLWGAVRRGHNPYNILEQAGIPPSYYDDLDASIDGKQFLTFLYVIARALNDYHLGLTKQIYKPILDKTIVEKALGCKTLGESIRARTELREALRDDIHYEFILDTKNHEFCLSVGNLDLVDGADEHLFYWLKLSNIYRYHCWLTGKRIKLKRVDFATPAPSCGEAHLKLFHCEVALRQPHNRLCFDNRYLNLSIIRTKDEILGQDFIEDFPNWLEIPGQDQSLTRRVEQALKELYQEQIFHPSINLVAKRLKMSGRTLRKHLARENENLRNIKFNVRKDLAVKHLISTDLPIATVALDLGFIEPGDFTRSFKRWTGYAPSEYRAKFG